MQVLLTGQIFPQSHVLLVRCGYVFWVIRRGVLEEIGLEIGAECVSGLSPISGVVLSLL